MAKLKIEGRFTIVPNELINDPTISFKAKGLYAYIHSKPDGWEFSSERIAGESSDGRDSVRAGLKELENGGWLVREKKSAGYASVEVEYVLKSKTENTAPENTSSKNTSPYNPSYNKDVSTKKENSKKETVSCEKEFQKFIEDNPGNVTAKVASRFISLGWKPKESVESFREWLTALATLHKADPEEIDRCSQEWAVYWKGRDDKKIKNFKTCFGNCPALPNNRNKWKK